MGAVEITVALHYVFDTPYDRVVWDVGHQAYSHKILTGRRDAFATNRKMGGLSGFPNPEESEYDSFIAGHASNSISAALGMAIASRIKGEPRRKAVRRALPAPGQTSGCLAQVAKSLSEGQRILNPRPVAQGEVGLQTELHPDRCTIVCLSAGLRNRIGNDVQVVLAERTAPDPDLLDLSLPGTGVRELEVLLYGIQDKHVGVKLESTLLVHDASELLGALELRRSGRQVQKETLVSGIQPLQYLLNGLAVQTAAADTLCKMLLHCIQTDVSAKQTVVAFLKCESLVPDKTGLAQHRINLAVAL